jgi:hypothetical protein
MASHLLYIRRLTFAACLLSGNTCSEVADFIAIRLIDWIGRPLLPLIIEGLYRFHEHIQFM